MGAGHSVCLPREIEQKIEISHTASYQKLLSACQQSILLRSCVSRESLADLLLFFFHRSILHVS